MSEKFKSKDGISFVIPAHNEEKYIKKTIAGIKDSADALNINYEIIVSNNNSADKTVEIAKELGAKVVDQTDRNISKTRNAGANAASYSLLCFVDADTIINSKALANGITKLVSGKKLVGAAIALTSYPTITSVIVWLYNLISLIFKTGAGPFVLIHKKDFEKMKGFDENIVNCEDIYFFRKAKQVFGFKNVAILRSPVHSSSRKFEKGKDASGFLFELTKAVLNFAPVAEKSDFWYSAQHKLNSKKMYALLTVAVCFTFKGSLKWLHLSWYEYFMGFATLIMIGLLSYVVINKKNLKPFIIIAVTTYIIEIIGANTGYPFGIYTYAPGYSTFGLLGVPLFIALAWSVILVSLTEITNKWYLTVIGAVVFDIVVENYAVLNVIWIWSNVIITEKRIFEAPVQNYISWAIIAAIGYFIVKKTSNKDKRLAWENPIYKVGVILVLFFHVLIGAIFG